MDDSDARKTSTHFLGPRLAKYLSAIPPDQVWARMDRLSPAQLKSLLPYLPEDCRCPLRILPCPIHAGGDCDCPATQERIEPCPHLVEARARDWILDAPAVSYLLARLNRSEYAEPKLADSCSFNTNPRAQVAVMAERRRRRRALFHPLDWVNKLQAVDERLTRKLTRLRNGVDEIGPLILEGEAEVHG